MFLCISTICLEIEIVVIKLELIVKYTPFNNYCVKRK